MTEFTVGEYPMRNGKTAVVLGEIPNPMWESDVLIGYGSESCGQRNYVMTWTKDGKHLVAEGVNHYFDLMPRKKKLESWGFVYYQEGEKQITIGDSEQSERSLRNYFANTLGLDCSEVFKYPDLEVDE